MKSYNHEVVEKTIIAIQEVVGNQAQVLHEPRFNGKESDYLLECLSTGYVSSIGSFVDSFEQKIAHYTGVDHAVAVVNGTAALHISLILAGLKADEEVLIPSLTFIATANAVSYCGAVPHFVDIEEETLGIDVKKLDKYLDSNATIKGNALFNKNTGARIRAIVPMHCFGHPSDVDKLQDIARRFKLVIIEDAAESLGSTYKGRHMGNFGRLAAISFNGNKIITTGGGGAILTNDHKLAKRAKHLTTTARVPHGWEFTHDEIGFNYRMPNLNAALGCAQIENIEVEVKSKRSLALKYKEAFKFVEGIKFFEEPSFSRSNYWLQTVLLDENLVSYRDEIIMRTNQMGIGTRPAWTLIGSLKPYQNCPSMDLEKSKNLASRIINLPSSASLGG